MNHEEASSIYAAEAYMLGDLTAEEREAFEEHFFSCRICAQELLVLSEIRNGLAEEQIAGKRPILLEVNYYSRVSVGQPCVLNVALARHLARLLSFLPFGRIFRQF